MTRSASLSCLVLVLLASPACGGAEPGDRGSPIDREGPLHNGATARDVVVNHVKLTNEQLQWLYDEHRVVVGDGRYWYDARSGLFGIDGGTPLGVFVAGLSLGGPLARDASRGESGVFVNGRELHALEVEYLSRFFTVSPGRFWLDRTGNVGDEGSASARFNLWQTLRAAGVGAGGGDNYYGNISTGAFANSDGTCSYVMVDGASASVGCG
ncbi:hypothetical protein L6R52_35905 [Myxococcota bacterium]|nr:hypothetical protein [Myxococcota bacterium]